MTIFQMNFNTRIIQSYVACFQLNLKYIKKGNTNCNAEPLNDPTKEIKTANWGIPIAKPEISRTCTILVIVLLRMYPGESILILKN